MPALLAASLALVASAAALPEEGDSTVDEAIDRRRERIQSTLAEPGITGGWFGAAPWLEDHGIRFTAAFTGFGQDPWSGDGDMEFQPGGKLDGILRLDLHKLGLWEGLTVIAHPEYNLGESVNGFGGAILPYNVAMRLPGIVASKRFEVSSVFATQKINDAVSLTLGKTNLADVAALHPYAGGAGITGFMNGGIASAPSGTIPPYVHAGLLTVKTERLVYSLALYGGTSAGGSASVSDAFDEGYLMSAGVTVPVRPCGLPGTQSFSVVWGDRDSTSLSALGDLIPPTAVGTLRSLDTNRLLLRYSFHQQLGRWQADSDRGWGLWGRVNVGENDLTAVRWSLAGGIGGDSPFPGRGNDRWGVGGFWFSFADFLRDPAFVAVPLNDERGIELFYNAELTPWLRLTADIQVVDPALPGAPTAVVGGLRTSVRF